MHRRQPAHPTRGRDVDATETPTPGRQTGTLEGELLDRIISVERQMKAVMAHDPSKPPTDDLYENPARFTETAITDHGSPGPFLNVEDDDGHTFVGETSSLHALRQAEARLNGISAECRPNSPLSNGRPLTPKLSRALDVNAEKSSRSWLRTILLSYGIMPEKRQCDTFLRVFFDEIHVLYPFLHPPSVQQTYEYLWQRSFLVSSDDLENNEENKTSVAIVFICLAIGRCTASSRVVYLFRLDASEKAERILAHAISSAHILGLHRKVTYAHKHVFEDEMFTRVWWCLYALDRRLSLETGRPFVIQDVNNDTRIPCNVSDDWLERHKSATATVLKLENEIRCESLLARKTAMPYLEATITYSRVVGDVWKAVYGADATARTTPGIMCDYLDLLLENWRQTIPSCLKYEPSVPYESQFSDREWWQIKQCLFSHMRYTFLKLLIRRPAAPSNALPPSTHDNIANEVVCAQLASSIVDVFDKIPAAYPKYAFPFMSFMMSAAMILFSIVIKNPGFKESYRRPIISAVQNMLIYCRKTWVSGKTIRTVSKLNRMVRCTLGQPTEKKSDEGHDHHDGEARGQHDSYSSLNYGTSLAATSPSSLAATQAPEQRYTSHDWATPPGVLGIQQNDNALREPNHLARTHAPMASESTHSAEVDTVLPSPASTAPIGIPSQPARPQSASQPGNLLLPGEDLTEFPFLWPSTSPNNVFTELPSWAMTDFDFEQAIGGPGNLRSTAFAAPELPDLDDDTVFYGR
ncbi:hypothetical protein QQX98_007451 [Neonectria punicea]|uniref:Xylanolytic transcriptional activator regulatory domain-containing protein n=1 Tax=Neonectria punicea TaxID=979145 RepID=A0ABR1GXV9_9HYPO